MTELVSYFLVGSITEWVVKPDFANYYDTIQTQHSRCNVVLGDVSLVGMMKL